MTEVLNINTKRRKRGGVAIKNIINYGAIKFKNEFRRLSSINNKQIHTVQQ